MYTFQDFLKDKERDLGNAVGHAIKKHMETQLYRDALVADAYDHQRNITIMSYCKWLYSDGGNRIVDDFAANHKLCSNFFNRLNTQRMTYSLGNGITFTNDGVKERLGIDIDTQIRTIAYYSLIHGLCFAFLNQDRVHPMPITEFAPLWDEQTSTLRAGVRFWQIDRNKPSVAILYEEDGYTRFEGGSGFGDFKVTIEKRPYRMTVSVTEADAEPEVLSVDNYGGILPIVPFWGSRLHQSTLTGIRSQIDAFDLVRSGFANDLQDCSEIYWIVGGVGGATDADLARFRDRLKLQHIASVTDVGETPVTPYTQELPYQSRKEFLEEIRHGIFEDFGALDVYGISASNQTATAIESAYQPLDENADDFEYQLITGIQLLLNILNIEDTPIFKRNRISNQKEQTEMVLMAAQYLDDETILKKLPFLTPDEIDGILDRKEAEDTKRLLEVDLTEDDDEETDMDENTED